MRKDMGKVVIERPRHCHYERSAKARHMVKIVYRKEVREDFEDTSDYCGWDHEGFTHFSGKKAVRFIRKLNIKQSTDLLGPIKRFLRKSVGRSWNDVYSEASEVLGKRNIAVSHVLEHLCDMVNQYNEYHITESGEYKHSRWRYEINSTRDTFIVDASGILHHLPKKYTKKRNRMDYTKIIAKNWDQPDQEIPTYFLKCLGVWFEVRFSETPSYCHGDLLKIYYKNETILRLREKNYLVRKIRTLSKKEIMNLNSWEYINKTIYLTPEVF
jgi:hypothetical protein